jgi:hydrogenase/urease accessory protein HupE
MALGLYLLCGLLVCLSLSAKLNFGLFVLGQCSMCSHHSYACACRQTATNVRFVLGSNIQTALR